MFALAELPRTKISDHGRAQIRRATEWLIRNEPHAIETLDEFAVMIEEQDYAPSRLFESGLRFPRHAFDLIVDKDWQELQRVLQ